MKLLMCFPVLLLLFITPALSQKHANTWMWGYDSFGSKDYLGGTRIDFHQDSFSSYKSDRPMNLTNTLGVMCDSVGELLFYSNGIYIANVLDDTMKNGGGINPGYWADEWSADLDDGYRVPDGMIVLPDLQNQNHYRLFHKCMSDDGPRPDRLLTTLVDMYGDNGLGEVVDKNKLIYTNDDQDLTHSHFSAVRHANGRDWWLVNILYESQELLLHLYSPDSIYEIQTQSAIYVNKTTIGQCQFSPDGSVFASGHMGRHNPPVTENSLHYYAFDRCTGIFIPIFYELNIDTSIGINGVVFSPLGKYLYRSYHKYIFRYNTEATDILSSKDTIAEWDGLYWDPNNIGSKLFPVSFGWPVLGPDGHIYLMSGGATPYMHQIKHPDDPALTEVIQNIPMPTANAFTRPNFPNYYLGPMEGSPCAKMFGPPTALYQYVPEELIVTFEDFSAGVPLEWHWDFGDGATSEEQHPQHTYLSSGTYNVCLKASNIYGSDTKCQDVKVETTSFQQTGARPEGFAIRPNPARSSVEILWGTESGQVTLLDAVGREVMLAVMQYGVARPDLSQLPAGSYMVRVRLEDGREYNEQLIVK